MTEGDHVSLEDQGPHESSLQPSDDIAAGVSNIGSASLIPTPAYNTTPYNPAKTRENFRGLIAFVLIALMTCIIIASFTLFWIHPDRTSVLKDFFGLIFGPVVALVGTVTGYYFGSQSADKP